MARELLTTEQSRFLVQERPEITFHSEREYGPVTYELDPLARVLAKEENYLNFFHTETGEVRPLLSCVEEIKHMTKYGGPAERRYAHRIDLYDWLQEWRAAGRPALWRFSIGAPAARSS